MNQTKTGRQRIDEVDVTLLDPNQRPDVTVGRTSQIEKEVYKTMDSIKRGASINQIKKYLSLQANPKTNKPYTERYINSIVEKANAIIMKAHNLERVKTHHVHIARYNELIHKSLTKEYTQNPHAPWLMEKEMSVDLFGLLATLKQKEELLGVHRKAFKVTINNNTAVVINNAPPKQFDLTNLSLIEKVEMMELLGKCKSADTDGVILRQQTTVVEKDIAIEDKNKATYTDVSRIEVITTPNEEERVIQSPKKTLTQLQQSLINQSVKQLETELDNRKKILKNFMLSKKV